MRKRCVRNETAATIDAGSKNSYPAAISTVMKIAMRGAPIAPAITAVVPRKTKSIIGSEVPKHKFEIAAKRYPPTLPIMMVGAKSPATPPPLLVAEQAKGLAKRIPVAIKISAGLAWASEPNRLVIQVY